MTKTKLIPAISAAFFCYNEEHNIAQTVSTAIPILKKIATKWELLIIDDGSTDNSPQIIQKLATRYGSSVRIITHQPNRGYGAAVKSALYQSKYPWLVYNDGDGQFDFSEVGKFIKTQQQTQADLVIGYYLKRQVPFYRLWGSTLWQIAVYLLFGLKVRDIDCGFKLISRQAIKSIPKLESERGPFISSELLIKAKKQGLKIVEIGVHHYPRKQGVATGAQIKVILAGLTDLVKLRFKI